MANTKHITIWSTMTGKQWDRPMRITDVEAVCGHDCDDTDALLDGLFRFFNRVDAEDSQRLEQIGYELPSLTSGDFVQVDNDFYLCASVGWTKVDMRQALSPSIDYLAGCRVHGRDNTRPAMFFKVDDEGALIYMHPAGWWKRVPLSGPTTRHDQDPTR